MSDAHAADADARKLFEDIVEDLAPRGASSGAMFGKRALKAHGKAFSVLHGDRFAVRLGAGTTSHAQALALPGAELFDPSGKGRPFKDWVALPVEHAGQWHWFAEAALDGLG